VETEWAMGFFFAVRADVVRRHGLQFDEKLRYYAYAEDLDFTHRFYRAAKSEGLQCIVDPAVTVAHNCSREYRTPSRSVMFMMIVHRCYLSAKLFGSFSSQLYATWSNLGNIILALAHREPVSDVVAAQLFCFKHYNDIKQGNFHYSEFMK
jgi:GT2 family glycosyltransferase